MIQPNKSEPPRSGIPCVAVPSMRTYDGSVVISPHDLGLKRAIHSDHSHNSVVHQQRAFTLHIQTIA